jgi:hypothetical protein
MGKKVLIAGAIRQRPEILSRFLTALKQLDVTDLEVEYFFIDDNDDPFAVKLLRSFVPAQNGKGSLQIVHTCDEYLPHVWTGPLLKKVAGFKQQILEYARQHECHLFLVDSDLILHPATLQQLLATEKEIVAEVYYASSALSTDRPPNLALLPPVWVGDPHSLFHYHGGESLTDAEKYYRRANFLAQLSCPGLYEVGGVRGCIFISRATLQADVSFQISEYLNLPRPDDYFSIRAGNLAIKLYVDTHFPACHLDTPETSVPQEESKPDSAPVGPTLLTTHWKQPGQTPTQQRQTLGSPQKPTLMLLVRNDELHLLQKTLTQAKQYIDRAVIFDLTGDVHLPELCRETLPAIRCDIHPAPALNELDAVRCNWRQKLWEITVATPSEWILALDPGEILADPAIRRLPELLANPDWDHYAFQVYDFWNETHFREDILWQTHLCPQIRLVRYQPNFEYQWSKQEITDHFPANIKFTLGTLSNLRIKNYGWATPEDRLARYERYRSLAAGAGYEVTAKYKTLCSSGPRLVRWIDS